jgi:hypothetical protein
MKKLQSRKGTSEAGLLCPSCGNDKRFIEVMHEEAHLVNARRVYIKLIEGVVDRYLCWEFGVTVAEEQ